MTSRQSEGVGLRHVDDLEAPGPSGSLGGRGELAPDRRHVALELGVANESHRLLDLLRLLGPELGRHPVSQLDLKLQPIRHDDIEVGFPQL